MKNKNKGFTLQELLIVVAILVMTIALICTSVVSLQKGLSQTDADALAREIYIKAQENITKIVAGGNDGDLYDKKETVAVNKDDPNCPSTELYNGENLRYVTSKSDVIKLLLPEDALSGNELENTIIIEYDPTTGSIVSVFYTDVAKDAIGATDFYTDANQLRKTADERSQYADNKGINKIGYYGVGVSVGEDLSHGNNASKIGGIKNTITIVNDTDLKLIFTVEPNEYNYLPITTVSQYSSTNKDGDEVTLSEKYVFYPDASRLIAYDEENNVLYDSANGSSNIYQFTAGEYSVTRVVDALEGPYFENQFVGFVPGKDVQIALTSYVGEYVQQSVDLAGIVSQQAIKKFNSYFANLNEVDGELVANINNPRHLRNLGKLVDVNGEYIENAKLTKDINMTDVDFTPINNKYLKVFNGNGFEIVNLTISSVDEKGNPIENLGLFGTFGENGGGEIKNLTLINTTIEGNNGKNVGAIVGYAKANVTITNCGVYLNDVTKGDKPEEHIRIKGENAGGLVGTADGNLTIVLSYASTVLYGSDNAGGLVGYAASGMSIDRSYADCYISGGNVGGLTGYADAFTLAGSYYGFGTKDYCVMSNITYDSNGYIYGTSDGNTAYITHIYSFDVGKSNNGNKCKMKIFKLIEGEEILFTEFE